MGQILSQSEVETILAGLDLNVHLDSSPARERNQGSADPVAPYDFEHPEPLRQSQLESLKLAAIAGSQSLQTSLSRVLQSLFDVKFLGVEQSTYHDYLSTAETPGCVAVFEASHSPSVWLLDIGRPFSFAMIDCLLGGQPFQTDAYGLGSRSYTDVEVRLIDRATQAILPELAGNLTRQTQLRMTSLVADGSNLQEASSNEAVALVSFEVASGANRSLIQLCIPWKDVAKPANGSTGDRNSSPSDLRSQAGKIPVVATAQIARLKLSAKDLSSLTPGDLLLTDVSATQEMTFDVDGHTVFRGTPGQSENHKVIRLTEPVGHPPKDAD